MARFVILAAMAAATVCLAFCEDPPASKGTPAIGVFLDFDSAPGTVPVEAMENEVDKILKPSGLAINWRLTSQNHGDESFAGLVVLKFKGKCRVEAWAQPGISLAEMGETRELGATEVVKGHVLPFSEVQCDEVRRALAYLRPGTNQNEQQRAFGIALGRVVAHEIYHVLARTTVHAGKGLAKATESLEDLVSAGTMGFREEDSRAIRKSSLSQ